MIGKAQRQTVDYTLLILLGIVIVFGMVMLSSASTVISFQRFGDPNYLLKRQLISFAIGLVAFFLVVRIDYHIWRRFAVIMLVISILLLVFVLLPGVGTELLGAQRWINIGGIFFFQPTELVKLTFLIYLATWLEKRGHGIADITTGLIPFLTLLFIITGLVIAQPDLGTMIVIGAISLVVYFAAGAPYKHLGGILGLGAIFTFILIKVAPYRAARFSIFLNPELDPQGIGYHINQALLAIGSGGLFGVGLGHSRQKFNYLPESAGDSIFAVIAEELGFFFVLALIALFIMILMRGIKIARTAQDDYGRLLATGITAWIVIQAFVNMAALVGLLPLTGIPLPFISYGGTSLIFSMVAAGILLNISRYAKTR